MPKLTVDPYSLGGSSGDLKSILVGEVRKCVGDKLSPQEFASITWSLIISRSAISLEADCDDEHVLSIISDSLDD